MLLVFFFNDTATTEIYTLSLHDALPIFRAREQVPLSVHGERDDVRLVRVYEKRGLGPGRGRAHAVELARDRKSTRLNSSHANISYAVFCLKKKTPSGRACASRLSLLSVD